MLICTISKIIIMGRRPGNHDIGPNFFESDMLNNNITYRFGSDAHQIRLVPLRSLPNRYKSLRKAGTTCVKFMNTNTTIKTIDMTRNPGTNSEKAIPLYPP